jgi:hypothetical protein
MNEVEEERQTKLTQRNQREEVEKKLSKCFD